jgi:nucleoside-diphosphate-sugar epimerase
MPDAIDATLGIMNADYNLVKLRGGYNVAALDFTPQELASNIKSVIPDFEITYVPDFRQAIADSWPDSIDDSCARQDWGWKNKFDLKAMTIDMIANLQLANVI